MKKVLTIVGIIALISFGLYFVSGQVSQFLFGESFDANAVILSGKRSEVELAAKELNKEATVKERFDAKLSQATVKSIVEGKEEEIVYDYVIITEQTAQKLIDNAMLRERRNKGTGDMETDVYTALPKRSQGAVIGLNVYLEGDKLNLQNKVYDFIDGGDVWVGYMPTTAPILVVDDATYKAITGEQMDIALLKMKDSSFNSRDKELRAEWERKIKDYPNVRMGFSLLK
ncbi:MAG: lipoprotein BA_5634 family protein [Bacilli bacterium]